jgi:hypothetical protein
MKPRPRRILLATAIGVLITACAAVTAHFAATAGASFLASVLRWPNTLLQAIVPLHNIGTLEQPFYEATPLNLLAFMASFPLAAVLYSVVSYAILSIRAARSNVV